MAAGSMSSARSKQAPKPEWVKSHDFVYIMWPLQELVHFRQRSLTQSPCLFTSDVTSGGKPSCSYPSVVCKLLPQSGAGLGYNVLMTVKSVGSRNIDWI